MRSTQSVPGGGGARGSAGGGFSTAPSAFSSLGARGSAGGGFSTASTVVLLTWGPPRGSVKDVVSSLDLQLQLAGCAVEFSAPMPPTRPLSESLCALARSGLWLVSIESGVVLFVPTDGLR